MKKVGMWLVLGLLLASMASAQPQKGDTELQLQGTLSLDIGDAGNESGSVSVVFGQFLTDRQEVGGSVSVFIFNEGDFGGVGGPFWRYNFSSSDKVPYVGAALYTGFGDFTTGDLILNLEAGVRFFLQRNMAFSVAGSTLYDLDESELSDTLQVLFGFSYFWER